MKQETINRFLVKYAQKGKMVVRLKGGDPFCVRQRREEAECLSENGIPFEIIPGITSGIAAAAYAGIPVTHREAGSNVAFVTGHYKKKKILRKSGKRWLQELIHLSSIWVSKTCSRLKENSLKTAGTVLRRQPLFIGEQRTSKNLFFVQLKPFQKQ